MISRKEYLKRNGNYYEHLDSQLRQRYEYANRILNFFSIRNRLQGKYDEKKVIKFCLKETGLTLEDIEGKTKDFFFTEFESIIEEIIEKKGEKIHFPRCPICNTILRTPSARQCTNSHRW